MKRHFCAAVLFLLVLCGNAEDFKTDFSTENIPGMRIAGRAAIKNGILNFQNGGDVSFAVDGRDPLKISFRMRAVQYHPSKNPPAWNLTLTGADNETGLFRFRQDGVLEAYFYKNGQRKDGMIRKFTALQEGEQAEFTLFLFRNSLSVRRGAQEEIGNARHPGFLPLTEIRLSTYNLEAELGELTVEALPRETPKLVEKPTFSIDFENEAATAFNDRGEAVSPIKAANIVFPSGIDGKGISLNAGTGELSYDLEQIFNSKVGGLMFWVKMNHPAGGRIFELTDGKEPKISLSIGGDRRCHITVKRKDEGKDLDYVRALFGAFDDWTLVALTWDADSNSKFFINMLPYLVDFTPGQRMPDFMNADANSIKRLNFLANSKAAYTIDRLRFFHRPLKNSEVYDEYRNFMPFDMVLERSVVPAGTPTEISIQVAPGGFYTRPMPVENKNLITGTGKFTFTLKNQQGDILLREEKEISVDHPIDVRLKEVTLAVGSCQLECVVNGAYKRTFVLDGFTSGYKANESPDGLRTGKLLFARKFDNPSAPEILKQGELRLSSDGSYLEAGCNKNDRFSIEIPFDEEQLGKPVALDITWPDDKIRMMGWYMYPFGFGVNRDRLQTGVSAGNEFPNSGKMQTTRHIFYPGTSKYLFEARTMATDMPAAVAEIKIYEISGGLPALTVRRPSNLPGRNFGTFDEDQTFANNLNADVTNTKSPAFRKFRARYPNDICLFTEELLKYFDYTGMNTLHSPVWRYDVSYFPLEGQIATDMFPGRALPYVLDSFAQHGKRFIAMANYANLPDIKQIEKIESNYREAGMETLDCYGDSITKYLMGNHRANICHPKVLELFASYFEEPVKRYGHSGLVGIEYWISNFGTWESLEWGYDDYTVNKFNRETGIKVPEQLKERYPYLTTKKRAEWLKWRSEQVTNLVKTVRKTLDRHNPELKLYLGINQDPENYEKNGVDLDALRKIPNVSISVIRHPTGYRHDFHWGKEESTKNEELYDYGDKTISQYFTDGSAGVVISYNHYFETYVHPLDKKYNCYFENADIKPHGRWYLREAAFVVGAFDAQEYVAGAQPLPSIGREEETREFAKAYGALPAKTFQKIGGIDDPVTARFLHTENGTYFYLVNMFHDDVTVKLDFSESLPYEDLSSGRTLEGGTIQLKPFQLRSFLLPKKKVDIGGLVLVSTGENSLEFYRKRIATLKTAASLLAKENIDVSLENKEIAHLEKVFREKRFAELYRAAFAKRMNQLLEKQKNMANLIHQQRMIDKGHYAVNCGSHAFYTAPDGVLFLPDQGYDGRYGYLGKNHTSCSRDITELTGANVPELYKTESYFLDRYKFKVPNGTYNVIFYLKAGFKPNFKPGIYRFSILANDKTIFDKVDLYSLANGDFNKALKLEAGEIQVTDGELTLSWRHEPTGKDQNASVCLANGIEVIKQ